MIDLTPILHAVQQAADLCSHVQRKHLVSSQKDGKEPVTIADYGSQAIICRAISQAFPGDAVLAEERSSQFVELVAEPQRKQITDLLGEVLGETVTQDDVVRWLDLGTEREAARTWVVDPVDGTKGFVAGRHYAIAVGLLYSGQPAGAVLGAPGYPGLDGGALFYALEGGAYMQPMNGGSAKPIHVSDRADMTRIRLVESLESEHSSRGRIELVRELAGMSLPGTDQVEFMDSMEKYGRVACGEADLYLRIPNPGSRYAHKVWDHAAGTALVQAAGGTVSDLDGSPLVFSEGRTMPNKGMIVSNARIYERVLQAVQQVMNT